MTNSNSLQDLMNMVRQTVLDNLKDTVGLKVREVLKTYVDQLLYQSQYPKEYERTFELLNSLSVSDVIKTGRDTYLVEVYFESNKIRPHETAEGHWNQHMSTDGHNTDESANIPFYMEYGHGGLYHQESLGFTEEAYNYLKSGKDHIKELEMRLKAIGIECKYR